MNRDLYKRERINEFELEECKNILWFDTEQLICNRCTHTNNSWIMDMINEFG